MQLTPFCLMLSCLRVSPNRSQFFRYDTITLTCEDQSNSTSWKVKRETPAGGVRPCSSGWGSASSGSTCIIGSTYPSDSGVYWCESVDGEQSNGVNITITVGAPYLVSTILLGLIYRDRKRAARTVGGRRGSNDVIMEIVV
ncbi:low affinity immunoglobulin gamma Fc region receptor II-like isoform X3 [Lates japonicus]|nr:low affinity immunoglobulin gamma Fc region receptor II-like isoform X3 [Lates japonicus]